jgi:hypothetical protein
MRSKPPSPPSHRLQARAAAAGTPRPAPDHTVFGVAPLPFGSGFKRLLGYILLRFAPLARALCYSHGIWIRRTHSQRTLLSLLARKPLSSLRFVACVLQLSPHPQSCRTSRSACRTTARRSRRSASCWRRTTSSACTTTSRLGCFGQRAYLLACLTPLQDSEVETHCYRD